MGTLMIHTLRIEAEPLVSTCSHVAESTESDACAAYRRPLLRGRAACGALANGALLDGRPIGSPTARRSRTPRGALVRELMTNPCL